MGSQTELDDYAKYPPDEAVKFDYGFLNCKTHEDLYSCDDIQEATPSCKAIGSTQGIYEI